MNDAALGEIKPKLRVYPEKIGDRVFELSEAKLDVHKDVALVGEPPATDSHHGRSCFRSRAGSGT